VRAKMNVVPSIFVVQNFPVTGHQYRNRIRTQKHSRRQRTRCAIQAFMPDTNVLQFHRVHQMMQGYVRVAAANAGKKRRHQATECDHRISSERAEEKIEPDHIRLNPPERIHQPEDARRSVERPATIDCESFEFVMAVRKFVGQHRKAEERIALQLLGNVKSIFTEPSCTGRKRRYQTDLHSSPNQQRYNFDVLSTGDVVSSDTVQTRHRRPHSPRYRPSHLLQFRRGGTSSGCRSSEYTKARIEAAVSLISPGGNTVMPAIWLKAK
jgi:hypothetical protein